MHLASNVGAGPSTAKKNFHESIDTDSGRIQSIPDSNLTLSPYLFLVITE